MWVSHSCCRSSDDCRSLRMSRLSWADTLVPCRPLSDQMDYCSPLQHQCQLKHEGAPLENEKAKRKMCWLYIAGINTRGGKTNYTHCSISVAYIPSGHPLWLVPPLWHSQLWPWITCAPEQTCSDPLQPHCSWQALWKSPPSPPVMRWSVRPFFSGALEWDALNVRPVQHSRTECNFFFFCSDHLGSPLLCSLAASCPPLSHWGVRHLRLCPWAHRVTWNHLELEI